MSNQPLEIMPFGKYKGMKIAALPDQYRLWLMQTKAHNQQGRDVQAAIHALGVKPSVADRNDSPARSYSGLNSLTEYFISVEDKHHGAQMSDDYYDNYSEGY